MLSVRKVVEEVHIIKVQTVKTLLLSNLSLSLNLTASQYLNLCQFQRDNLLDQSSRADQAASVPRNCD